MCPIGKIKYEVLEILSQRNFCKPICPFLKFSDKVMCSRIIRFTFGKKKTEIIYMALISFIYSFDKFIHNHIFNLP